MTKSIIWAASALLLAGLSAGCTTPPDVRDLARTTAANASVVNSQLSEFAGVRRALAERRADATAQLHEAIEARQAGFDGFLESARASAVVAGTDDKPNLGTLIVELRRVADAMQARQDEAERRSAQVRADVLASQAALTLPKDQLSTISSRVGELAKEPSRGDRLAFFKSFLEAVLAEIDDARKEAESSGKSAESDIAESAKAVAADVRGTARQ